jgi:hypothetical protein
MAVAGNSTKIYSQFDPRLIAPMYAWYDAADGSTMDIVGGQLRGWRDKTSNGFHLSAPYNFGGTITTPPVVVAGGLNGLSIVSGGAMAASTFSLSLAEPFTVLAVSRVPGNTIFANTQLFAVNISSAATLSGRLVSYYTGVSLDSVGSNIQYWFLGNSNATVNGGRGVGVNFERSVYGGAAATVSRAWTTHCAAWQPGRTKIIQGTLSLDRFGGSLNAAGGPLAPALMTSLNPIPLVVGECAELLFYRGWLNSNQFQALFYYLSNKWNASYGIVTRTAYDSSNPPVLRHFHPYDIDGLVRWYDAADTTTITPASGNRLLSWVDKSQRNTNGSISPVFWNMTAANYTYGPGSLGNNLNTIAIAGSANITEQATLLTGSANPITMVLYANAAAGGLEIGRGAGGGSYTTRGTPTLAISQDRVRGFFQSSTFGVFTPSVNFVTAARPQFASITVGFIQGVSSFACVYESGVRLSEYIDSNFFVTGGLSPFYIWSQGSAQIQLGEFMVYRSNLTTIQREMLEGYISHRWGITGNLPASHPYKVTPPYTLAYTPTLYNRPTLRWWLDSADRSTISTNATNRVLRWSNKHIQIGSSTRGWLSYGGGTVQTLSISLNGYSPVTFGFNGFLSSIQGDDVFTASPSNRTYAFVASIPGPMTLPALLWTANSTSAGRISISQSGLSSTISYNVSAVVPLGRGRAGVVNSVSGAGFFIGTLVYATGEGGRLRFNGNSLAYNVAGSTVLTFNTGAIPFNMGGAGTLALPSSISFHMAEFIQFNEGLDVQDVARLEGYLAWKWGLKSLLPSTHPFKVLPP